MRQAARRRRNRGLCPRERRFRDILLKHTTAQAFSCKVFVTTAHPAGRLIPIFGRTASTAVTGLDRNSDIETRSVSEEEAVVRYIPRLRFGLPCCQGCLLPEL